MAYRIKTHRIDQQHCKEVAMQHHSTERLGRRAFLVQGTLFITGANMIPALASNEIFADSAVDEPILRVALMSDIHFAEKEPRINRYYKESLSKLQAAAKTLEKQKLDFLVELGDFIDSVGSVDGDKKNLRTVNDELAKIASLRHYVLGNHCVETLTKEEFLAEVGQEKSYYSFDRNGYHFVVLDGTFRQDGIPYGRKNADWKDTKFPKEEIEWLKEDLADTKLPAILFLHQRLDLENLHAYSVKNADEIRAVLEASEKVRLVVQGHYHKGDYKEIAAIPYCTLSAVIEGSGETNNAFSLLEITQNGNMKLHGFFKQKNHDFPA